MKSTSNYKRVLLKLSGESLMGSKKFGLHQETIVRICDEIKLLYEKNIQVCMVVGAGNIFRGITGAASGFERISSDYMGILGTVINALALQSILEEKGVETRVLSAIQMSPICEPYFRKQALSHLEKGRVVIFSSGTGNPLFTTDTAATLRAIEMNCDAILKGTLVDGVYDSDPKENPKATRYQKLKYQEVLEQDLRVMDTAAIVLARDNGIPILVFSICQEGELMKIINGLGCFTIIEN